MIYTQEQVWDSARRIAPAHLFDPYLMAGVFEQECEHPKGNLKLYDASVGLPEPAFYRKYIKDKFDLATTTEVLFACSYGVPQMLGVALFETRDGAGDNYYEKFLRNVGPDTQAKFDKPTSMFAVVAAINFFCVTLDDMVEWACLHMSMKRAISKSDSEMLLHWNGGGDQLYDDKVLTKRDRLAKELPL